MSSSDRALAEDVRRGLSAEPRSLPPKWFYDAVGSALFDEICDLPEYYLTRAERVLVERHADAIAERTRASEVVELGSGMARKTGVLLSALRRHVSSLRYVPFDVSREAIEASARSLRAVVPDLSFEPIIGDFESDLATAPLSPASPRTFAFLGSTIGNLDERAAPALCDAVASRMREGDTFLLGVDLVKGAHELHRAYDDAAGVTARFNKNVLAVINRVLAADFDLDAFAHVARWNAAQSRIEMYLESKNEQRVRVRGIDATLHFRAGERILTEISRKFTRESVQQTLAPKMKIVEWYELEGPCEAGVGASGAKPPSERTFALVLAERA